MSVFYYVQDCRTGGLFGISLDKTSGSYYHKARSSYEAGFAIMNVLSSYLSITIDSIEGNV